MHPCRVSRQMAINRLGVCPRSAKETCGIRASRLAVFRVSHDSCVRQFTNSQTNSAAVSKVDTMRDIKFFDESSKASGMRHISPGRELPDNMYKLKHQTKPLTPLSCFARRRNLTPGIPLNTNYIIILKTGSAINAATTTGVWATPRFSNFA